MDRTQIRKAAVGDVSRIAEILVFNNRLTFFPIFQSEEYSFGELQVIPVANAYLNVPETLKNTWVYDDYGIVKGLIRLRGREIEKLYVDPCFHDKGIGGELLEFAVHGGADFLWALEKNTKALAFYERHGFYRTDHKKLEEGTTEYLVKMER